MTRKRTRLVLVTVVAATAGGALWALSPAPASGPATLDAAARSVVAPALVEAEGDRIELAFQGGGRVVDVLVDEGDRVALGQVVARVDAELAKARVLAAEAALAGAEARRDLAVRGPRREELRISRAEVDAARAQAWERGVARDRAEKLRAIHPAAIAAAEVDSVHGAAEAALAQVDGASARLALLARGTRKESIAEAGAAVALAAAQLIEARVALAQTELIAPRAGVVLRRLVEPGEQVATMPPTPVLVIADVDRLTLRAEVDEADIGRVTVGQPGWAIAEAYGDHRFAAHVVRLTGELGRKKVRTDDARARVDTRVLEVMLSFDEPAALPLGLRMDVHLAPDP